MATTPITSNGASTSSSSNSTDLFKDVSTTDFLKLMITELQNQDPLNPMDNAQLLQQVGEMQSISTSLKLNDTLQGVLLGENLNSSSGLIGKIVAALDDDGKQVAGTVDAVSIVDGKPKLHVGNSTVSLSNVKEILGNQSG